MECSNIPLSYEDKHALLKGILEDLKDIPGITEVIKDIDAIGNRLHADDTINKILTKAAQVKQLEYELSVMERVSEEDKKKLDVVATNNTDVVHGITDEINKLVAERYEVYKNKELSKEDKETLVTETELKISKLYDKQEVAKELAKDIMHGAINKLEYNQKKAELKKLRVEVVESKETAKSLLDSLTANIGEAGRMVESGSWKGQGLTLSGDVAAVLSMVDVNTLATKENGLEKLLEVYKKRIKETVEIPVKDYKGKAVGEYSISGNKEKGFKFHGTLVKNDPGLALLVDVSSGEPVIRDNVAMALAVSVMTTLQDAGYSQERDIDDVIKEYGLAEPKVPGKNANSAEVAEYDKKMAAFYAEVEKLKVGKPLKVAAYEVGKTTLDMLGLKFGDASTLDQEATMIASLGNIGMQMAIGMGLVQDYVEGMENSEQVRANLSEYIGKRTNSTKVDTETTDAAKTVIVRMKPNMSADHKKAMNNRIELFNTLFGNEIKIKHTWSTTPLKEIAGRAQIHNGTGRNVATQEQTDTLNKIRKIAYKENGSMDTLIEVFGSVEEVMKAAGWYSQEEIEKMVGNHSQDYMDQVIGTSKAVERKIEALMQFKELPEAYFDWFVTVAGRYGLDSTTVNPQTDKDFARWMVIGKDQTQTVNIEDDNSKAMKGVYWTIAQSFGEDVDKLEVGKAIELGRALVDMDEKDLIAKMKEPKDKKAPKDRLTKTKLHPGQAASALVAIRKIKEARKSGAKTVELSLLAEVDGKTNGFAIRLMQFPFSNYKKYMTKVGIVKDGEVNGEDITSPGQLFRKGTEGKAALLEDTYETAGKLAAEKIAVIIEQLSATETELLKSLIAAGALPKLYEEDDKGKVKQDANGKDMLNMKTLRDLAKNPTMTFNYSAGEDSMIRGLVSEIATTNVEAFMGQADDKTKAALSRESVRTTNDSNARAYRALIMRVYAMPMVEAIQEEFNEYVQFNAIVNGAYRLMYEAVNMQIESDIKKTKGAITKKGYNELLSKYADVLPGVGTIGSSDALDKLIIANRAMTDRGMKVNTKVKRNGEIKNSSTRALSKGIASPGNSGSVLTIHNTEGSIISKPMRDGAMGINDALAAAASRIDEYGSQFNMDFFNRNMEFSMLQALWEQIDKSVKFIEEHFPSGTPAPVQNIPILNEKTGYMESTAMHMSDIMERFTNMKIEMEGRRAEILGENWSVMQMGGMEGTIFKATTNNNEGIMSAKEKAIKAELKALIVALPEGLRKEAEEIAKNCI